jgi:dihydrofolate reductase
MNGALCALKANSNPDTNPEKDSIQMRNLLVFNQVSLDGYIADDTGDMSWAHQEDAEWNDWVASNASGGGELLFGRVTYEQMESFWPSAVALAAMPVVAERMNNLPKVVFSRTLAKASWNNTRLVKGAIAAAVKQLKREPGQDMVLMGSASIVSQLSAHGLIDAYQVVINPIVLGRGKSMFTGVEEKFHLKLTQTRTFKNGNVVLSYERAR